VTAISIQSGPVAEVAADAVIVGVYKDGEGIALSPGAAAVDEALGGTLAETLGALGATGAAEETTRVATAGKLAAPLVVAVGLGEAGDGEVVGASGLEDLRRSVGAAVRSLAGKRKAAIALAGSGVEVLGATAEGAAYGAYAFDGLKTGDAASRKAPVAEIVLVTTAAPDAEAEAAAERARVLGTALNAVRDLINTPPSHLHPQAFAEAAEDAVKNAGSGALSIEVLDDVQLREGGYGGLTGVGQGSVRGPRLVKVSYTHPAAERKLAFVGKGITFDTGGISLKPGAGMEDHEVGHGRLGHRHRPDEGAGRPQGQGQRHRRVVALAENMPDGNAIRPGDILTSMSGQTIEVNNTDAEGRLVLADAAQGRRRLRAAHLGPARRRRRKWVAVNQQLDVR
jgi:leucyl aminopeptidase